MNRLPLAALAAAGFLLSGCVGFTVKPPKPASLPKAEAPAPLKVGVSLKQRFDWEGMGLSTARMEKRRNWRMFKPMFVQSDDVAGRFLRGLRDSAGFARVDEVKSVGFFGSGGDNDLIIEADFSGKYRQDAATFSKAFLTGFLLLIPAPFVRYEDDYFASAEVSVYDNTGRLLHKYSERQDVVTSAALFSAGAPASVSAGIESAASHLASKLVAAILADRAGYQRAMSQPSKGPARPVPAPDAAPAPVPAPVLADAEPTAAAAADAPVFAAKAAPAPLFAARPAPAEAVLARSEAAHAELAAEEARIEPDPPAQAAREPKPARRGPLTSAEEQEIDEQVMP